MPTKKFDILGLGVVAVDEVIYVASYPPPDSKASVLERQRRLGGLTSIALISAARLGASCAYAGVLGQDELSRFALGCLRDEKIDVSAARQAPHARPIHSNIVVDQQHGTRNIFFDVRGVVGARRDVPAALIAKSRVLFVDNFGVNGMIRAARLARRASVPVIADFERWSRSPFRRALTTDRSSDFVTRDLCRRSLAENPLWQVLKLWLRAGTKWSS
jgi:sugar/nucleoside kinase (ribokinase family)